MEFCHTLFFPAVLMIESQFFKLKQKFNQNLCFYFFIFWMLNSILRNNKNSSNHVLFQAGLSLKLLTAKSFHFLSCWFFFWDCCYTWCHRLIIDIVGVATRQSWEGFQQCCTVSRMADSVNNWVINCVRFRKERSPDGGQRREFCELEDASEVDDEVGGPCHEPKRNRHQRDLGKFALSTLGAVFSWSQRSHLNEVCSAEILSARVKTETYVHLLGLIAHVLLVRGYRFQDEIVRVDDQQEWQKVNPSTIHDDVGSAKPGLCQVISTAGGLDDKFDIICVKTDFSNSPCCLLGHICSIRTTER